MMTDRQLTVNFTVANLLVTDIFPKETQALAGAVYQATSQLGISIGIAVLAVIQNTVTNKSPFPDKESPDALLTGFRAVFWACFGMMVLSTLIGMWGLRGRSKVGQIEEDKDAEQPPSNAKRLSSPLLGQPQHYSTESGRPVSPLEDPQAPLIQRKPLPPSSTLRKTPRAVITPRHSWMSWNSRTQPLTPSSVLNMKPQPVITPRDSWICHNLRAKPLPKIPQVVTLPTSKNFPSSNGYDSLNLDGEVTLDHILELYDRGEVTLMEGYAILDQYYSWEYALHRAQG